MDSVHKDSLLYQQMMHNEKATGYAWMNTDLKDLYVVIDMEKQTDRQISVKSDKQTATSIRSRLPK